MPSRPEVTIKVPIPLVIGKTSTVEISITAKEPTKVDSRIHHRLEFAALTPEATRSSARTRSSCSTRRPPAPWAISTGCAAPRYARLRARSASSSRRDVVARVIEADTRDY
ncbi:MAG: hypothetical protein H0T79_10545 [Deltaproteobacteria bacterium]|nr:hypothetical protein [Deltaproteobacteria bacterium]